MPFRLTIADMQKAARHMGGKCLSKEYINVRSSLAWMCAKGHTWDSPYSIIKQGGWCVVCARGQAKLEQLNEMKEIARSRGGKCLSEKYTNIITKLKWQCSRNHFFSTTPQYIKQGL